MCGATAEDGCLGSASSALACASLALCYQGLKALGMSNQGWLILTDCPLLDVWGDRSDR